MFLISPVYIILFWAFVIALIYIYSVRKFNYWKTRNVVGPKPLPIIGNVWDMFSFKFCIGDQFKQLYNSTKEPYVGFFIFDEPCLLVRSPEIIKNILIKDFNYFKDRTIAAPKHDDVFANLLFSQKSPLWKNTRQKVTPVLSAAKLRSMFSMLEEIGESLISFLKNNPGHHDGREVSVNYSIDVIVRCFFGINAHSFKEENAYFKKLGEAMFGPTLRNGICQGIYFFKTALVDILHIRFFDEVIQNYFVKAFVNTVKSRQQANYNVNDFVATLVNINKEDPAFDYSKIAALGIQFFSAGFETTASTIAFTLYEMAMNPTIQEKARAEITSSIEKSGSLTYDSLKEMKYLNMCVLETLRKYPSLPFLDRRCNTDYKVPGSDLVIEAGIAVYISILGVHNDAKYFPEPEKYNPDRFHEFINSDQLIYFPFGEGPRNCIGEQFGTISARLALIHILSNFLVEKTPDTPATIYFHATNFTLQPKYGLPLTFKEISGIK